MLPGDGPTDPPVLSDAEYILWLEEKVEALQKRVESEYERGLQEGSAAQAILEIQGRERWEQEIRERLNKK